MVKYLKENEDIIRAAEARSKGRQSEYMSVLNEYKAKGFAQDDIVKAVNGVINSFGKEDKEEQTETDTDETISIWKTSDIIITLESGENADNIIKSVYDEKVEKAIAKGKSESEARKGARSSIKSSLTSHFKPLYLSGDSSVRQIVLGIKVDGEYLYTSDDIAKWK
jgi:5,10-methenyltetrahydromethanopterin hydrogenase